MIEPNRGVLACKAYKGVINAKIEKKLKDIEPIKEI